MDTAEVFIRAYESIPRNDAFSEVDTDLLTVRFIEPMNAAIKDHFGDLPLNDADRTLLHRIAALWMCSDILSDLRTGFVFAGYGRSQIFPVLIAFECDGLVGDAIKKKQVKTVHIDRISTPAEVVPFAQHEMVDRFLYAIDPEFEKAIEKTLEKNLSDIGTAIIGQVRLGRRHKTDLEGKLKDAVSQAIRDFRGESVPQVKREFWNQIRDTLLFMTKPDLANFAESLVNITSIKRRVSLEQETVGGPIDVAVISKSDGFVWVKRKYYFDGAINHRFFERKRAILAPALRGDKP